MGYPSWIYLMKIAGVEEYFNSENFFYIYVESSVVNLLKDSLNLI